MNKQKSVIYYHPSAFSKLPFGLLMNEAMKEKDAKVYFITCNQFYHVCKLNPNGNDLVCKVCRWYTKKALKNLPSKVNILNLNDFRKSKVKMRWNYNSFKEMKKVTYKGVDIGYAVISSYIDVTRNLSPIINEESRLYFNECLDQCVDLTDAFYEILKYVNPDRVCIYNGRSDDTKPIFQISKNMHFEIFSFEVIEDFNSDTLKKIIYRNHLPHDIIYNQKVIERIWEESEKKLDEKLKISNDFFYKKRNNIPTFDKVYTSNQLSGKIPENWNNSINNIVIFNSSEDEFFSLGDYFDNLSLFSSQLEGIEKILSHYENNNLFHFYLRIHPNLFGVKYKYHAKLMELDKHFDNVTIIKSDDKISTYSLLDKAYKIIVFGSTIGLEAAYWGKVVILLAGSLYYYFDICYIPKTEDDVYKLIEDVDLKPKSNDLILKFAYSYSDINNKKDDYLINYGLIKYLIFNRVIHGVEYQKIFNSNYLSALVVNTLRWAAIHLGKKSYALPMDEE